MPAGPWEDYARPSADIPGVAKVESNNNPDAINPKSGAKGTMQVLDSTNASPGFGVTPARDDSEAERTRVGQDYLTALQKKYGREDGLRAYNWGPGNYEAWDRAGRDPAKLPQETREYVAKVTAARSDAPPWVDYADESLGGDIDTAIGAGVGAGYKADPEAVSTAFSRYGEAVWGATQRAYDTAMGRTAVPLDSPFNPLPIHPRTQAEISASHQARKPALEAYERRLPDLGVAGQFGDITPEVALSTVPINLAGSGITTGLRMLPRALSLGRAAPYVGETLANVGYEGGKSVAAGDTQETVLKKALLAAGGATAGRAGGSVVAHASSGVSPEVSKLMQWGITPTPGQVFPGATRFTEGVLEHFPHTSGAIARAKQRALDQYSRAEINELLADTVGGRTGQTGFKGINEGSRIAEGARDFSPADLGIQQKAADAQRLLGDLNDVAVASGNPTGHLTPKQFSAGMPTGRGPGYPTLNAAAREVLDAPTHASNLGVASGITTLPFAAWAAHSLGVSPAAIAGGGAALTGALWAGANLLYSERGIQSILRNMDLVPKTAAWLVTLTPQGQKEFVERMLQASPEYMKQVLARTGAQYAAEHPEVVPHFEIRGTSADEVRQQEMQP